MKLRDIIIAFVVYIFLMIFEQALFGSTEGIPFYGVVISLSIGVALIRKGVL